MRLENHVGIRMEKVEAGEKRPKKCEHVFLDTDHFGWEKQGRHGCFFVWPLQMLLHLSEPTEAISNLPTLMISRFLMI